MKLSVNESALGDEARWVELDHVGHQELADLWSSGVAVAAQHGAKSKSGTRSFAAADAVMVRIDLERLPLAAAMEAEFTQEYASVAAWSQDSMGGELLLAFELPDTVIEAKAYGRLMAGLETLYAGSRRHASALDPYGLRAPGEAQVLRRRLNDGAVKWLHQLGLETNERLRGDGAFLRSWNTIDRTSTVVLAGGDEAALEQLSPNTPVFCPVHVDQAPRAVVHWYSDGTPGIQCHCCRRTYATPRTRREYDFDHFDRVVADLAAAQTSEIDKHVERDPSDIVMFKEAYLPSSALVEAVAAVRSGSNSEQANLGVLSGVTFVKSPKGTNKTGVLEPFVAECKRQHLGVLMIGHRRSLLQAAAKRLQIDCYFTVDDDIGTAAKRPLEHFLDLGEASATRCDPLRGVESETARYRSVAPTRRYAICLDSIGELDPQDKKRRYDVVIIDESEQVFAHLVGDTIRARRREVYAKLCYYLRAARHVVLLDADLNMITMDVALEVLHPETAARFIVNQPTTQRGTTLMYHSRGYLAQVLADRAQQGKKIYVATNSKNRAYVLEKLVRESAPRARVAVVTADNSQTKDSQRLLANVSDQFEHHLDVLIASPTIGTGIDITFKDSSGGPRTVVDCVFGLFEGDIVTHFDIDQQLMRVRHPGEVHVWVDGRRLSYETDIGCITRELDKSLRTTAYLLRYEDDGKPVFADDGGLVKIWARVLAASRGSKNRLADLFAEMRARDGWKLENVMGDERAGKAGREAMNAAQEARKQERERRILSAEAISHDEAKELHARADRGAALTAAERWALERHQIEQFYGGVEISAELVELDDGGRTRQAVRRFECLTSNQTWFANKDADEIEFGVLPFDRRRYLVQRAILEALFVAAGIFDAASRMFRTDVSLANGDLSGFLAALEPRARQIEAVFGLTLYADRKENPVGQLKGILRLVGLDLALAETVQKDGKKKRRYAIPAACLDDLVSTAARRDARYKRADATPRKRQEDRVMPLRSKELQAHVAGMRARKAAAQEREEQEGRRGR